MKAYGDLEAADWWEEHSELLAAAWKEVGLADARLHAFDANFGIARSLRSAVAACRAAPSPASEQSVRDLWTEVALCSLELGCCVGLKSCFESHLLIV